MPDTLADYPYIIVHLDCRKCFRKCRCRLARLAARYGADIRLGELLAFLVGECRLWECQKRWNRQVCGAYFVDLESPRPPDLPALMREFKVVKGIRRKKVASGQNGGENVIRDGLMAPRGCLL